MNIAGSVIKVDVPLDTEVYLKGLLQWANPDYSKKVAMGKSTWGTPKDIVLWSGAGNELIVPFGMLQTLRKMGIKIAPSDHLIWPIRRFNGKVDNLFLLL